MSAKLGLFIDAKTSIKGRIVKSASVCFTTRATSFFKTVSTVATATPDKVTAHGSAKRSATFQRRDIASKAGAKFTHDLPEDLVKRLVAENISQDSPLKLGRKCVTVAVAQDIRQRWNRRPVVKIDASTPKARANLKPIRAALEELTGGKVIWNEGAKILLYDYSDNASKKDNLAVKEPAPGSLEGDADTSVQPPEKEDILV